MPEGTHPPTIGARLKQLREDRGKTQQVIADLAGMKRSQLAMMESGARPLDRRSAIEALAQALRVSPSELVGAPVPPSDAASRAAHASIEALRDAVTDIELGDTPAGPPQRGLTQLAADIAALPGRSDCDFAEVGVRVGSLVRDLHAHLDGPGRRDAAIGLVTCYEAARSAAGYLGVMDLAALAARQTRDAAAILGDPQWAGLADQARAKVLGSSGRRKRALEVATAAADRIREHLDEPGVSDVYGVLHLTAAHSANTLGDAATADAHLAEATEIADRFGGHNFGGWWFSRANVRLWKVSLTVERDEGGRAAKIAQQVDVGSLPTSRQAALWLDVGRGLAPRRRTMAQAVAALSRAEELAPQWVRVSPMARETVRDLRQRASRDGIGRELAGLAHRMGLPAA